MRLWILKLSLCLGTLLICTGAPADFRAAAAARIITPDPLLPVTSGGGGRLAKEKLGELEARVLVLENNGVRVAIVSEPFIGFPWGLCRRVHERVKDIPADNILIGATHTHTAPDPYGFPSLTKGGGANMPYLESVCQKTADAINEAVANLQPAKIKINTAPAQGKIAYNYYAPQLYDPRCSVIQAIGADGKPIATLVNYAIHPEVLIKHAAVSPDLIGPLYDRIAEKGGGIGVFMNGAQGGMITADVRTPSGDLETWEECIRIGNLLADEALRIIADAPLIENPPLFCAAKEITFPAPANPVWRMIGKGQVGFKINEADNSISARINVVNLDSAQMLTIPGEALPNIGFYLKRKMHGKHNLLFGLTNDAYGYILTKVDFNSFDRYKYVSETSLGEMTGEILIEESLKFVDSLPRPQAQ